MSNCLNCKKPCDNGDCGCIPKGLTTPASCPGTLPPCPQPSPCNETFDAKCVYYTGEGNACLGVEDGQTVETIIDNLASQLAPFICLECASLIIPANGSTGVSNTQVLNWNMIPGASSYDVYFGTDPLLPTLVSLGQILTSYTHPTPLVPNTTYYWKIIPYNLAGVPVASCPIFTFNTIPAPCVNPLDNFFDDIIKAIPAGVVDPIVLTAQIIAVIPDVLNAGELLTNCNYCCPDCTDTHRYVLASPATYAQYYSQVYSSTCLPPCCIEVDSSLTAMNTGRDQGISLSAAFAAVPPNTNCCGTNFSECVESIKNTLPTKWGLIFKTVGLVEESSFTGMTTLCIIVDFLNALPSNLTETQKANIITTLLTTGFVVDCRPEGTIIASVTTYITYLTSVSVGGCLCYEPCN